MQLPDSKGSTAGKVLQWLFIISTAGTMLTAIIDPSIIMDMATKKEIKHDVEALKDTIKADLLVEFGERIKTSEATHAKLRSRIHFLEKQVKTYDDLFEGLDKHTKFNTMAISVTNDALYEEMDVREQDVCPLKYRETNGGDNWYLVDDWYDSRILYSLDVRTGCRAYYTPFFREKTKLE